MEPPVVEVPQLRALVLRVPLTELVAEREHPLLGPCLLLVAARTTQQGVETVLLDGLEQHLRLQPVAGLTRALVHPALVDRLLDRADDEPESQFLDALVAERKHLVEVVAGVDVDDRERNAGRPERLLGQAEHHAGVLASGEEQTWALELGRDLADDVDRLGLERQQVRQAVIDGHELHLAGDNGRERTSCDATWPRDRSTKRDVGPDRGPGYAGRVDQGRGLGSAAPSARFVDR